MSVSLEAENGVVCGAYPNPDGTIPHVGLMLCDPHPDDRQILVAKLSPECARMLSVALADAVELVSLKWDDWIVASQGGFDE